MIRFVSITCIAAAACAISPATISAQTLVHGGVYAVQLNRTASTTDSGFDRDAPGGVRIPVTAGNTITPSFWARNGQAGTSSFNRVSLAFFTSGGAYINPPGDVNFESGTTVPLTWTKFTGPATVVPATATLMNFGFRLNTGSSVVLDDLSIFNNTTSAELLTNPGFETWPTPTSPPTDWRFFGAADGSAVQVSAITAATDWSLFH